MARMTRDEIANSVLEKLGFAVTTKGHKFDQESAETVRDALVQKNKQLQQANATRYRDEDGGVRANVGSSIWNALSDPAYIHGGGVGTARHLNYVAKQHAKGENAWNPFGGALTPLDEEVSGTDSVWDAMMGNYGKLK